MRNGNGKPPQLGGAAAVRPKQSPNAVKVNRLIYLIFFNFSGFRTKIMKKEKLCRGVEVVVDLWRETLLIKM